MDLFAHAITKRPVDQLMALHAALAGKGAGNNDGLEMLAIADDLEVLAGEACLDSRFHAFRSYHLSLYPDLSSSTQSNDTKKKLAATTARLVQGDRSDAPKKP